MVDDYDEYTKLPRIENTRVKTKILLRATSSEAIQVKVLADLVKCACSR